jgi:hypothetical protein
MCGIRLFSSFSPAAAQAAALLLEISLLWFGLPLFSGQIVESKTPLYLNCSFTLERVKKKLRLL